MPLLFVLSIAVRFPTFYTPTIDWDESTFILFGQHILNGGLPYVDYFDVKPPLLFYFFAAVIKLFGATIPAVRLAGALCVFVTASACYFLARHMWDNMAGLFAGLLCISGMSVGSGMAVLSENVAMAPLMICAYLVIVENRRAWAMFLAGACMGAAVLIRSNLAYACLLSLPGVLYILLEDKRGLSRRMASYLLGGVCVLLLTLYPFYARDGLGDLYRAVVLTPMGGMKGAVSVGGLRMLMRSWNSGWNLFLVLFLPGLLLSLRRLASLGRPLVWLCLVLAATSFSFFGGVTVYGHYVFQLVPILALFGGYALSLLHGRGGWVRLLCHGLTLYILLQPFLPLSNTLRHLDGIARHMDREYGVVESDESKAARYVEERLPEGRRIWAMDSHIIYWLLSLEPPSKYLMHPSKVAMRQEIAIGSGHKATALGVIEEAFDERPYFIVRKMKNWYIREGTPEGDLINATMGERYEKVAQFGRLVIFRTTDG